MKEYENWGDVPGQLSLLDDEIMTDEEFDAIVAEDLARFDVV